MTRTAQSSFRLETTFTPAGEGKTLAYALTLTNQSGGPISDFKLCISGPARIDPAATIDGGTLVGRLSNHAELAPPSGFVLEVGRSWTVAARGLSYPLRHWTDGATAAYVAFADGTIAAAAVTPTKLLGDDRPLRRGAEIYPIPENAPEPLSLIPWPATVSVSGRQPTPAGLDLRAEGTEAQAAAQGFGELVDSLFPVEGIVRPAAQGGLPVTVSKGEGFAPEA